MSTPAPTVTAPAATTTTTTNTPAVVVPVAPAPPAHPVVAKSTTATTTPAATEGKPTETKATETKATEGKVTEDGKPTTPTTPAAAAGGEEDFFSAKLDENDALWKGGHKNLPHYTKLLEVMPEEGRKWVANLRADYSRKTAEIAEGKRVLAEERQTIAAERARLAQLATPEFVAHLEQLRAAAKDADPFTAEGQAAIAEAKAVELYQRMIKPIQEQVEQEAAKARYRAYVAANPDFEDPATRKGVMGILQAKSHLSLEEAHDLWRGQRAREEAARLRTQQTEADQTRAKTLALTGAGGLANTEAGAPPTFKSAVEAEKYWRARGMK